MAPELFTPLWWSALGAIVVIDLVLAGDNAIVIGLAARNVPVELQRKVILWGTAGAIAVRVLLTGIVVWLLKIPGFLLVGGLALVWIGWKLTDDPKEDGGHAIEAKSSMAGAIRTIVVADAVMGVDNVLAIGGAAHGSMLLVVIGLLISVPIVVWGSTLVLKWVVRFPQILWIGAGVLGWTAAKMIGSEPLLKDAFAAASWTHTLLSVVIVGGLVAVPMWRKADPESRAQGAVVALLVAWLAAWGWIEDLLDLHFDPIDDWRWDTEVVDLVRWVGWIPVAIALYKALRARESSAGTGVATPDGSR
jgi:YjbE family integral membrane protein